MVVCLLATLTLLGALTESVSGACSIPATSDTPPSGTGAQLGFRVFRDSNKNGVFDDGGVDADISGQSVVQGELVFYRFDVFPTANTCALSNGIMRVVLPSGVTNVVTPAGGIGLMCPEALSCPINSPVNSQPAPYTVDIDDTNKLAVVECADGQVEAQAQYRNGTQFTAVSSTFPVNSDSPLCNTVLIPCLEITKLIACKPASPADCDDPSVTYGGIATGVKGDTQDPAFCYSIIISNCGTVASVITNVTDDIFGELTEDFTNQLTQAILPVGQTVSILFSAEHGVDTTNTVTVLGTDALAGVTALTDSASATALVVQASIACDKSIIATNGAAITPTDNLDVLPNTTVTYRVIVTNTGDAPLAEVSVNDPDNANCNSTGGTLPVGGTLTNQCDKLIEGAPLTCITNTVTVGGQVDTSGGLCGFDTNGVPITVSNSCDAVVCIVGECNIQVLKDVACVDTNVCAIDGGCDLIDPANYGQSAQGAQGAAFCYRIRVINDGDLTLNITNAVDNQLGDLTSDLQGQLAPGATSTVFAVKSYGTTLGLVTNTVTVRAECVGTGEALVDADDAVVELLPVGITCTKQVSTNGVDFVNSLTLDDTGSDHSLTYKITVENTGDVDLDAVTVSDVILSNACTLPAPFYLAAGASTNILCENVLFNCDPPSVVNTVEISAIVAVNAGVCALDINCSNITAQTSCQATVACRRPGACRVTGGGKTIPNTLTGENREWACQDPDLSTLIGAPPRYVTHGGQVGAPFAVGLVCVTNTPCIRGEWQHVRHIKGGLRGVFHARSNGRVHEFDSLGCACLPCPEDAIVVTAPSPGDCLPQGSGPIDLNYTNELAVTQGTRHAICNDGDRVCGPEPRRAPANKIAFSGLGDYALTRGKKAKQSVVFRVDIEDRSEPGGSHPLGATPPPDRYRIRIWFTNGLTADEITALRCHVAVIDPLVETVPAPAPDIDDGGALDRGNHQLHPTTGATPPADCGTPVLVNGD